MKSFLLALVLFVCILSEIKSQTLGLKINPNETKTNYSDKIGWGLGIGVFYDHNIYKRLGFSSGIFFTQFKEIDLGSICFDDLESNCPYQVDTRYDIIEIPLNLTLNFSNAVDSKWKFLISSGYSYGFVVNNYRINFYENYKILYEENEYNKHLHFFNAGCEIRYTLNKKINLSLGSQYQYTKPDPEYYGWMESCNIYFNTGVNLDKIKAHN